MVIAKSRKLQATLMIVAVAIFIAGCTHNNGDIGTIFGQWQLHSISADADGMQTPVLPKDTHMYWAFQSSTIRVDVCYPMHEIHSSYGNFRLTDETIFLDFPDENYPQLIPSVGRQSKWELLRLSGTELTLRLTAADGTISIWKFHKN